MPAIKQSTVKTMFTNPCEEVKENKIEAIVFIFKENLPQDTERIVSCLYHCFNKKFIKWATITYNNYPADFISFISNSSFTDGVLLFTEKAAAGSIYKDHASLSTILFSFYRIKLLENLQKEKRLLAKKEKHTLVYKDETIWMGDDEYKTRENHYRILEKALAKMEPADRQIIVWRHWEEKSCDEIATLLGINKTSATNRIYRCMQRLRSLTENSN